MPDIIDRLRSPEFADVSEKCLMAEAAAEIEFYRRRAIWWCAHAEGGLRGGLDERDFSRASKIIETERT